jgi:TolB-like protein/DNA-binding SARP family transcriptional activator
MDAASALHNGMEGLAHWSLRLFGDFQLNERPGGEKVTLPGKRERVLLAYLALSPNCRHPRRKLVTLLWGEAADETSLDNLRTCVFNLRKALGDTERNVIASEDRDIVLDSSAFEIDVLEFRRLAAGSGLTDLEEAAKLYSGDFLEGLSIESEEFESWRREETTRCRDQAIDVLSRLMTQLSASGESERAIEAGLRILRLEPLHEATVRSLMRLYGESGRRATAVELYRTHADALRKEPGAQPEAGTRAIFADISRGTEEQTIAAVSPADVKPPPHPASFAQLAPAIGAPRQATTPRPAWILAGLAAAAMAIFLVYQFAAPAGTTTAQQPTGGEAAKAVSSSSAGVISIAVLPFVNLSSDPEQEFFSDGVTEEITSVLAKIPDLLVVGRTSAFQFKGQNQDLRAIGQALAVTHLLEGSVRKDGNRLRINAELIQVENGVHVWTESYDRELTGVFAIQEEIALAIAAALRVPLGLAPGENLVSNRAIDPESYQQYLRAKALVIARGRINVANALNIVERLVERNPDYAPAWALLSQAYARGRNTSPKREAAARRAIELDPNLADGYRSLGTVEIDRQKLLLAEELISKALALDPNHHGALFQYGNLLAGVGRLKESLATSQRLRALEPFVPLYNGNLSDALWLNGQDDAAIAVLKDLPAGVSAGGTPGGLGEIARIYAAAGRYREAADAALQLSSKLSSMNMPPELAAIVKDVARLLSTAPANAPAPQDLPRLGGGGFAYLHIGAASRALEDYEEQGEGGNYGLSYIALLWHPSYAPVRKTERFKAYVRKAGLVDYWRARGWPDLCRPVGADDFACT